MNTRSSQARLVALQLMITNVLGHYQNACCEIILLDMIALKKHCLVAKSIDLGALRPLLLSAYSGGVGSERFFVT